MSEYSVVVTDPASESLDEAFSWINDQAPEAALEWHRGIIASFLSLESKPQRCPLAPECQEFGEEVRHLIVGRYRILFRIRGDRVEILAVRHIRKTTANSLDETSLRHVCKDPIRFLERFFRSHVVPKPRHGPRIELSLRIEPLDQPSRLIGVVALGDVLLD